MVTKTKPELYTNVLYHETAVIDTSTHLSSGVNINGLLLCGLTQAGTDWTAANITLQGSPDGVTYYDMYDSYGAEKTITVTSTDQQHILLFPSDYAGVKHIKFRSGTSGTPVAQAEPQTLYVCVRPADQSKQ